MYHSSGNWTSEHFYIPTPGDVARRIWRAWSAACAGAGHSAIVRMMALRHWLATGTPHAHAHMRSARSSLVLFAVSVSCLPTDKQQRRRQHRTRRVEGPDVCTRLVHATQHPFGPFVTLRLVLLGCLAGFHWSSDTLLSPFTNRSPFPLLSRSRAPALRPGIHAHSRLAALDFRKKTFAPQPSPARPECPIQYPGACFVLLVHDPLPLLSSFPVSFDSPQTSKRTVD